MEDSGPLSPNNVPVSSSKDTPIARSELSFLTKALIFILLILIAAIPVKFMINDYRGEKEAYTTIPTPSISAQIALPTEKELNQIVVDVQSGDSAKIASVVNNVAPQLMTKAMVEKISKLQIKIDAKTVKRDPMRNNVVTAHASVISPDGKIQKGLLYLTSKDGRWVITDIVPDKN